ncbi:MAG: hypothetical protein ACLFQU_09810 [Candidatus Kapaibacterium sp.]
MVEDEQHYFYLYEQTINRRTRNGLPAGRTILFFSLI